MGIGVVLIFYAIGLSIIAAIAAAIHAALVAFLVKPGTPKRKRAITAAIVFPFICVAYAGCWFVTYAFINDKVFHRDPGLGDSWYTPLPNGYALMMIDVNDQGTVYNPATQTGEGVSSNDFDTEFGVRQLQVSDHLIFGASDSKFMDHYDSQNGPVDTWFQMDTAAKTRKEYKSYAEFEQAARTQNVSLHLRNFDSVFGDYRQTWFDLAAGLVLLLPPLAAYLLLIGCIWKLRRRSTALSVSNT